MEVSKKITIDLNRPRKETVHLGQGDNTHEIDLVLLKDGIPFAPESGLTGVTKSVKYIASDGSSDENSGGVTIVSGKTNEYTVKLNHGETNVPGFTEVFVVFSKDGNVLHTFPITLNVIRTNTDINPSDPTYNVFLRKDTQVPKSSEMTQAVGVDEDGQLWVTPGGGGGSDPVIVTVTSGVSSVSYSDIAAYHANGRIIRLIDDIGLEYDLLTIDSTHSVAVFYNAVNATTSLLYNTVSISGTTATPSSMHAYVKPQGGIPATDLAFTPYTKPSGGIPSTDMTSAVQTSLGKADSAYQKPSGGIPESDIAIYETSISYSGGTWQSNHSLDDIVEASNYEKQLRFYNGSSRLNLRYLSNTYAQLDEVYQLANNTAMLRLFMITSTGVSVDEYEIGNAFEPTVVEVSGNTPTIMLAQDNTIYDLTGTGITSITITAIDPGARFTLKFDTPTGTAGPTFTYPGTMILPLGFELSFYAHYEISVDEKGYAAVGEWKND